ncbi:uncharacterized protein PHACADRAFT_265048 [Phanerochaete carnosa HHB-10118-sp]|uniref:Uncharacterized protein n=1 Tax=Phanerochaete carnosa (strain HHB-10118-sp) TaxID=650164 RepID=K5WH32_PHACS|nr:uncharacterized protein PHACADRAFT_265048 [Phanerochaete carnosa HHB-10118-sp]EKM49522.1 hypothetical protein PHACADRAFT_265048 [Phanerochaete carnosa HHB-10118-sp]
MYIRNIQAFWGILTFRLTEGIPVPSPSFRRRLLRADLRTHGRSPRVTEPSSSLRGSPPLLTTAPDVDPSWPPCTRRQ